jgi:hypothetical protein
MLAKAGIQKGLRRVLDSRLRGNEKLVGWLPAKVGNDLV